MLVENYRSIKKIEINNIQNAIGLIGENSSGKSSILSAILVFLGQYNVNESDFRFDKKGVRTKEIIIGIGMDLDEFAINRMVLDSDLNYIENENSWYKKAIKNSKGYSRRKLDSKAYQHDLKMHIKNELNIGSKTTKLYFKIIYQLAGNQVIRKISLTDNNFKKNILNSLTESEIEKLKTIIQPRYAYLHDERNFLGEELGHHDSTTSKLFELLLPTINSQTKIRSKSVDDTEIKNLTIPEIHKYLLDYIQKEASIITSELNKNFKKSYNENVEIDWRFNNQLFENLNIKTNFKFTGTNVKIDFQSVGSGTRSMYKIALLQTLLDMQREGAEPVLFLLEEPELYLYPKLENHMANYIHNISKDNQVIVTTHSHISILSFNNESLFKVYREHKSDMALPVTQIKKIESSLEAMQMLGYDITYLLGKDYLIFVEGKDDQKEYEYLFNTIFGSQFSSKFLMMTGVSKLMMAVNCSFLKYINTNSKSVFIIDSDGGESERKKNNVIEDLLKYDKTLNKFDFENKIIITEYCMLECYTFEKELLVNKMSEDEYREKKRLFIERYSLDINELLEKRGKNRLDSSEIIKLSVDEKFEYIRCCGLKKELVKDFRRIIGGSGFKKISDLNTEELYKYCGSLIKDLKNSIGLS